MNLNMSTTHHTDNFPYAFQESATEDIRDLLVSLPSRWGRMPPLCRCVVVEAAKILQQNNLLESGLHQLEAGRSAGLIGGTTYGSLSTDLEFSRTMKENPLLASPALFGYTLANIPIAEAANHFGLTGPVYAIVDQVNPFYKAQSEAQRILSSNDNLDFMLACVFDAHYRNHDREQLHVTFTLIE